MVGEYRKPLKPAHWDASVGTCRFCGEPVNEPRRRRWHSKCAEIWGIADSPSYAQFRVRERDNGKCASCGATGGWEVDHIKPLAEANRDFSYWLMENLATLCHECHRAKTKAEAGRRARDRRWKAGKPCQLLLPL